MSDNTPMPNSPEAETDMHIAINSYETAANLRKMGFDGAADELEKAGAVAAQQAIREGYQEPPPQPPYIPPGWEQKGRNMPPEPATTMGPAPEGHGSPLEWPEYHEPPEPYYPEDNNETDIEPPVID
jgi:hypothetical protein